MIQKSYSNHYGEPWVAIKDTGCISKIKERQKYCRSGVNGFLVLISHVQTDHPCDLPSVISMPPNDDKLIWF